MRHGRLARLGIGVISGFLAACLLGPAGCGSPDFFANNVTLRSGSVNFQFINDTDFRASFTFGMYDGLDNSPGAVVVEQTRVEAHTTTATTVLACRRIAVLGTDELIERAVDADFQDDPDFDRDAFVTRVNFSDAPADDPAAGQPTAGFSVGEAVLLGVDFDCGDRLIFTFVEDPQTPGGFRIDFANLPADDDDL